MDFKKQEFVGFIISLKFFWLQFGYWEKIIFFHFFIDCHKEYTVLTRSSWLNCALRDEEAVFWVIIGHYEAVAVGN